MPTGSVAPCQIAIFGAAFRLGRRGAREPAAQDYIRRFWQKPYGHRRQELVFIEAGFDARAITRALDAALIEDESFIPEVWHDLDDPFPGWRQAA